MRRAFTMLALGLSLLGCTSATDEERTMADTDDSPIDRFTATGVTSYARDSAEGKALLDFLSGRSEQSAGAGDDVGLITAPLFTPYEDINCSSRDGTTDCFCPDGCCRTETSCYCC